MENDIYAIRNSAATKMELLEITSDILDHALLGPDGPLDDRAFLRPSLDKAYVETLSFVFFEMREHLIPFFMKKGDLLLKEQNVKAALDIWEEILKVNPDNPDIHTRLIETGKMSPSYREASEELRRKYRLEYMGTFGSEMVREPVFILPFEPGNEIFVSDKLGDKIHKFNAEGDHLGALPVSVSKPMGLFRDSEKNLWICDFDHHRLLASDMRGNLVAQIGIREILPEGFHLTHPAFACVKGNRFFVILTDSLCSKAQLVSFERDSPSRSLQFLPYSGSHRPVGIAFSGRKLIIGNFDPGALLEFNLLSDWRKKVYRKTIFGSMQYFVRTDNDIFLISGKSLSKLSPDGKAVFIVKLNLLLNEENTFPLSMAVINNERERILWVSDKSRSCIHRFLI